MSQQRENESHVAGFLYEIYFVNMDHYYIKLDYFLASDDPNILTPPKVEQLALLAEMSVPKLYRCFKELYKITIADYVRGEKMKYAMRLLWDDGMSVKAIFTKVI